MLSFHSTQTFHSDHSAVFTVRSKLTQYRVVVTRNAVKVIGPGVEEDYSIPDDIASALPQEEQAVVAVILFEGGI